MAKRVGQMKRPVSICRRLIDFITGSLIFRSFSRLAFIYLAPQTRTSPQRNLSDNRSVSASAGPNAHSLGGHDPATANDNTKKVGTKFRNEREFDIQTEILVNQGSSSSSSKHGVRERHQKTVMSGGDLEPEAATRLKAAHHVAKPKLPVHLRPHFLDVETNINEKTDEFIKSRKAAMRQT